jgi:hypothetical protein
VRRQRCVLGVRQSGVSAIVTDLLVRAGATVMFLRNHRGARDGIDQLTSRQHRRKWHRL